MTARTALAAALALLCGCSTVIPAQTASTVSPGSYRIGAQLTGTPYCSVTATPLEACQRAPTSGYGATLSVFAPELRVNGRYGVAEGWDLGLSLHSVPNFAGGFRAGAFVDGKRELHSRPMGGGRGLLSIGLGGGLTVGPPNPSRPGFTQLELALPLFAGWQTDTVEWVVSPRLIERFGFSDVDGDGAREVLPLTEVGLSAALFTRSQPAFFVQAGYSAPVSGLSQGPFTLGLGVTFDVAPDTD